MLCYITVMSCCIAKLKMMVMNILPSLFTKERKGMFPQLNLPCWLNMYIHVHLSTPPSVLFFSNIPHPQHLFVSSFTFTCEKITLKKAISFRLRDEAYMWTQLRREETLVVLPLVFPLSWYMVQSCKAYLSGSCL